MDTADDIFLTLIMGIITVLFVIYYGIYSVYVKYVVQCLSIQS